MIRAMRWIIPFVALFGVVTAAPAPIPPGAVAVVYNSAIPESKALAEAYQKARMIPAENLIGLKLADAETITRDQFDKTLLDPLRAEFSERHWWKLGKDQQGQILAGENKIRVIALMRGVPLRIARVEKPVDPKKPTPPPANPQEIMAVSNEASVDSELMLMSVQGLPTAGPLKNPYFDKKTPLVEANLPFFMAVGRIDGASWQTCHRLIADAQQAETNGLWGRSYIDIANKVPEGDLWLENCARSTRLLGFPTIVDRFNDTLPTNYPLTDAAIYYGWYIQDVNGPFLLPGMRFRTGAVACHLHSFSAQQLRDPNKDWSAALLERGAAATVGNVYEPYLSLTHHFDKLQARLEEGYTLVEAAAMAIPCASWQNIVLGDPLYRPFSRINGTGEKKSEDLDFRALVAAHKTWPSDDKRRSSELEKAADKLNSGTIFEALGWEAAEAKDSARAAMYFQRAKQAFKSDGDKVRQELSIVALDRTYDRKATAIAMLRTAQTLYRDAPEVAAVTAWLTILDPPPPPPAQPAPKS